MGGFIVTLPYTPTMYLSDSSPPSYAFLTPPPFLKQLQQVLCPFFIQLYKVNQKSVDTI
jgi:hypothetical protein